MAEPYQIIDLSHLVDPMEWKGDGFCSAFVAAWNEGDDAYFAPDHTCNRPAKYDGNLCGVHENVRKRQLAKLPPRNIWTNPE